jgi:drug/metabolite transporter (DMT)-like permease
VRPLSWLGPLALTITGGVVYHVSAKSLPKDLNPALVLVGAYATALCGSLAAYVVLPGGPAATAASSVLSPAVISVGLGATMIELGYVLTYRAAWPVSVAAILVNSMVAVVLVVVGVAVFSERLSLSRALGLAMCLAGAWLLRR